MRNMGDPVRGSWFGRRRRVGGVTAAAVVAGCLVAVAAVPPAAVAAGVPRPDSSVPTFRTSPLAARPAHLEAPRTWKAPTQVWPAAGTATVSVPGSPAGSRLGSLPGGTSGVRAGKLPVRIAPAGAKGGSGAKANFTGRATAGNTQATAGGGGGKVEVTVEDSALASRLGVAGLVVAVRNAPAAKAPVSGAGSAASRSRTVPLSSLAASFSKVAALQASAGGSVASGSVAGGSEAGGVVERATVSVDYAGVAAAFGGGWGARARLVSLPDCALSTPELPRCRIVTPVPSVNNTEAQRVSATVSLSASSVSVLAAAAGSSGSTGDFTATDLKPSGSWNAGGSSGGFTYSYPVPLPPVPGGLAPEVSLNYDSQSVDGQQVATNSQASWVGDGWDYSPGSIERSYLGCSQLPTDPVKKKGDLCWAGHVVSLSFGKRSGSLVHDTASPTGWRLAEDDGTRVELLTGAVNSARNGEYWKLTTPDGTQYFFGRHRLPGYADGKATTNSVLTVPVYGAHAGDPCYSADGFASSVCDQAWRWNLDYVASAHGQAMAYYYAVEQNYYASNVNATTGKGTLRKYLRSGWLQRIDYGLSSADPYATPPARVVFSTNERCIKGAETDGGECDPTKLGSKSANWPDVPWDQNCFSTATGCGVYSPTFWTRKRLTKITTQINSQGAWKAVDQIALSSTLLDPGDGTASPLWLSGIGRTAGTGEEAITVPKVEFG
ncbi:MAG: hypothetical protein QG608_3713, partial [Actinomycetota bacterium]|nr:hypothetical protein [Actinomycetota bacterium]